MASQEKAGVRTLLPLILLLSLVPITATATPWCEGYQKGYETGYQAVREHPVFAPACPLPRKRTDPNNYQDGYRRGARDGEAQAKQECGGRRGLMSKPRGCR